jgi:diguanylate cyclase (GGDEF)-like protein
MTILIVDGDAGSLERLRAILAEAGQWNVGAVCSGTEALRLLESGGIDLVLADLMAPEMGGLALCREIKSRSDVSHIPVVMMVDNNEHEYLNRAYEAGVCEYIMKPVEALDVLARVRAVLRIKKDTDGRLARERALTASNRRLLQLSVVDAVTGIANRRGFDQTLDREWRSAARQRVDVALLMIDVDFFKPYNDRLGHLAGDQCLRSIAEALSRGLKRPDDFLARYGGEEFSVILPRTDAAGAGVVAERMRSGIEELGIGHPASPVADHITISQGVACMPPKRGAAPSILVAMADEALYEAKGSGRNRSCTRDRAPDGWQLSGFVAGESHNRTPRYEGYRPPRIKPQ